MSAFRRLARRLHHSVTSTQPPAHHPWDWERLATPEERKAAFAKTDLVEAA
jgi:hypothetical protein